MRRYVFLLAAIGLSIAVACTGGDEIDVETAATPTVVNSETPDQAVRPFTNIAPQLGALAMIQNRYPGVAIFDYDRDGDLDFYVTSAEVNAPVPVARGGPNRLFRNDGADSFTEVAADAGVAAETHNSTAVVACDFNNDGYQDLYIGAQGRIGDKLDYRSVDASPDLRTSIQDRLYLNLKDGTFRDVTASAFGAAANVRSTGSVACGDVDGDGWLDLYVGNRGDVDFVRFDDPRHHGHFNVLYRNNRDLTFTDVTVESGLLSPPIVMRDPEGNPIMFENAETGVPIEGFDTTLIDDNGNVAGDPAGQTWATMFFDHDDDGDPDLWVADDGDRLKVYRNDSTPSSIKFTNIAREMGIDQSGAWMGFALGDYDNDQDLDVFVTNIGFHPLTRRQPASPGGDCAYAHQFDWGTCFHYLLRNDGTRDGGTAGTIGQFVDVAGSTRVIPSELLPPESLDASNIDPAWQVPAGLAAYDFGFGAVFFDLENDGDQDLYWFGSIIARGEGPRGMLFPGFGRMMLNREPDVFQDVTVETRLIDSQDVDYSVIDPTDPAFDRLGQRLGPEFHENGKGLAKGDLNGDGYPDLIATNSNGEVFDSSGERVLAGGPLFVWLNGGGDNSWVTLRLKGRQAIDGTGSNADAIGARVLLTATGPDGAPRTQVQEVLGSSTFLSMSALDLTFGLGSADIVDRVVIRWPSGVTQELEDIAIDRLVEITEPGA